MVTPGENANLGVSLGSWQRQGDSRREQQCSTVMSSVTLPVRKQRLLEFNETSIPVFKNNWELRFLDPTTRVYRSCVRTKATGPSANCEIHLVPCRVKETTETLGVYRTCQVLGTPPWAFPKHLWLTYSESPTMPYHFPWGIFSHMKWDDQGKDKS